jgi:hypothetical protein
MASRGENVSRYFTNQFTVVRAVRSSPPGQCRCSKQPMLAGSNAGLSCHGSRSSDAVWEAMSA